MSAVAASNTSGMNHQGDNHQFLELVSPPDDTSHDINNISNTTTPNTSSVSPPAAAPVTAVKPQHRAEPSGDSSLFETNPAEFLTSPTTTTAQHGEDHEDDTVEGISYYSPAPTPTTTLKKNGRRKKLRLFFSASDLLAPSGGASRIRSAFSVVYLNEVNQQPTNVHFSHGSVITEETGGTNPEDTAAAARGTRSSDDSDGVSPAAAASRGSVIGRSERAHLTGRDVEFCRHVVLRYSPTSQPVLYIEIYGVEGRDSNGRSRLVGTTSIEVEKIYSQRGFRVAVPLIPPPPQTDGKRRKIPNDAGKLRITAEDVTPAPTNYNLDIMCDGLKCARPWGNGRVKRAFYTIHVIATSEESCDDWVLLHRSNSVSMVKKKRFGGSMEYNYFSSRPLLATPGLLFSHEDDSETSDGLLRKVQDKIKNRFDAQFFSMPSSSFALISPSRRLKLTIWEDHTGPTGANLVADTNFSMAQLRKMKLGDRLDMFVHSDIVGHATLKFVERCPAPAYFCLSIQMPDLVQ